MSTLETLAAWGQIIGGAAHLAIIGGALYLYKTVRREKALTDKAFRILDEEKTRAEQR